MNQALKDNLGKCFDKYFGEEVQPELQKYVSIKDEPLLTIKQAALCLNIRIIKLREFLIKEGFIGKCGHVTEDSLEGKFFKTRLRNFAEDRKQIPLVRLTREGFMYLGALFIALRNANPYAC